MRVSAIPDRQTNLVTNGDFSSSAGWTLTSGSSIGSGQLTMVGANEGINSVVVGGLVFPGNFRFDYDIISLSADATIICSLGGVATGSTLRTAPGTYSQLIAVLTSVSNFVIFQAQAGISITTVVDNLKCFRV